MQTKILFLLSFIGVLFSNEMESPNFSNQSKEICCPPLGILAPAKPCSECVKHISSLSFLFWQGKIWGLEFATKSFLPNVVGAALEQFEQKLFVPDFAWRPGVKVQYGEYLPHDGWDLIGTYTYYHEEFTSLKKHFDSQVAPEGIGIIPLWHYPFLQVLGGTNDNPLRYRNAAANWHLHFHSMDLELGRLFFPELFIPMRLTIGAKGAYIYQFYHADYGDGTSVLAVNPNTNLPGQYLFDSSRFQAKTHQWGLGPRIFLESRWKLGWGLNLIGNGGFSILASSFDMITKYRDVILPSPGNVEMKMKEHFRELTPVCEAKLGLDWNMCICRFFLNLQVGYEYQYWWSINHARRSYVQTAPGTTYDSQGDLQMQGLNAAVKVEF